MRHRPRCGPDSFGGAIQLRLGLLQELVPGRFEFLHAFVLQHEEHVGQVDPDRRQRVENFLGGRGGAGDRVAGDDTVVGDVPVGVDGFRGRALQGESTAYVTA